MKLLNMYIILGMERYEFVGFFIYAMIQSFQVWDDRVHCATSEV
jgi:hypothetical protein